MKILIHSTAFAPSVGGIETMAGMLAEEFSAAGHCVTVSTSTESQEPGRSGFRVLRRPALCEALRATVNSDVVLHMNLSLKALWAVLLARRPLVIGHYGHYKRANGRVGMRDRIKYWVSRFATNIACSTAVKQDLPNNSVLIGNAYQDDVFTLRPEVRTGDLVFVGRLVSEKGVDTLLAALLELALSDFRPKLTIVGSGPEEPRLRKMCSTQGLSSQVDFAGTRTGEDLAILLNRHRVMVVPSRNEGFGIVALEGIACGCVIVGSNAGGLPEAIGACGLVFRVGDVKELSAALWKVLTDPAIHDRCVNVRVAHLNQFARRSVAQRYLAVLEGAVRGAKR